ncbi:MAG: caspase family protein, partial [Rhodoferax sp.]
MKSSLLCLALAAALVATFNQPVAAQTNNPDKPAAQTPAKKPLSGAALLQLDDGRSGKGNLIATTGVRSFGKPPSANAHALIMAIGDYQGNIPKLKGVAFDTATATEIARRMGVPLANIRTLKDGELTLAGMRQAFDELEARLDGNEQVFIYYSGHGGRQTVREEGVERCAESLITFDGQAFIDSEVEGRLRSLARKTQKTIVFLDSCHSGGVTTRALAGVNPPY